MKAGLHINTGYYTVVLTPENKYDEDVLDKVYYWDTAYDNVDVKTYTNDKTLFIEIVP